jgi:anaerobic selenocysteine-containing dehydrogenase
VRSFCRICTAICGIVVDVSGDRVVRARGDDEHPLSHGYTCRPETGMVRYSGVPVTVEPAQP